MKLKEMLMKVMFKKEIEEYEESINLLNECILERLLEESNLTNNIEELGELIKMYEQELVKKEKELRLMNLIVENLKLYGEKDDE